VVSAIDRRGGTPSRRSVERGRAGRFQLEAAIQSVHAERARSGRTEWAAIMLFYEQLIRISPTLGTRTGYAAAVAEAKGAEAGHLAMNTPPIVSQQEWEAARQQLLVKEKALTRSRDALAAERRRMPWLAVDKKYEFDGPKGKVSLLDLFEGRRQLIVYRAFFEPGVFGWPEHACRGCSLGADQVAHLAHLNARDTTLAYASRAPQADIARLKARMGWEMPWYTITDSFDADFGVDEWHGHNVFFRDGERVFRTYFINNRGDEAMGTTWSYLDITPLGRQETWEDSPEGYPQTPPYKWWNWHDNYDAEASPDPKWVDIITDPQEPPESATQRRKRAKRRAPLRRLRAARRMRGDLRARRTILGK
jgi:predicted dithiol-disulfide oxidoreductase (DUF899 family)